MSVLKDLEIDVKPFKFGSLIPDSNQQSPQNDADAFKLDSLKEAAEKNNGVTGDVIRSERKHEAGSGFAINPLVREHRGITKQENEDYEKAVSEEVEKRLEQLSKNAYEEGLAKGKEEGMEKAYAETLATLEEKVVEFTEQIKQLDESKKEIISKSKDEGYKLIKNLTKWIVLKEVDDKDYIPRLLEKLILEMNTKSNLLIKVDNNSFQYMPEIIKTIESKLGQLTNVRVEVEEELHHKGIILESENGIIDGTLKAQFVSIDKLFESVGIKTQSGEGLDDLKDELPDELSDDLSEVKLDSQSDDERVDDEQSIENPDEQSEEKPDEHSDE